jgi:hypothetical protein
MPRPKTEMTKSGKTIAVRATLSEWNEFKRLGGIKWLRKLLAESLSKRSLNDLAGLHGYADSFPILLTNTNKRRNLDRMI